LRDLTPRTQCLRSSALELTSRAHSRCRRATAQAFTVALVLGCGIMAMLMLQTTTGAIERARDRFYDRLSVDS
jgi:hypothetical protein